MYHQNFIWIDEYFVTELNSENLEHRMKKNQNKKAREP